MKQKFFGLLILILVLSGCSTDGGGGIPTVTTATTANIVVQLQVAGSTNYLVDHITVSIQKAGGLVLTGVTGSNGIARITVTETGDYQVLKVDGVDASALAEGSDTGREFVKVAPLADPYPNLTYTFSGITVSVTVLGSDYPVNVTVPSINRVTVLKVGSSVSDTNGNINVAAGTAGFAGRVMISNLNCSDNRAGLQIVSSDANINRLHLYMNITALHPTPEITDTYFYGGPASTATHTGFVNSYTQAGPIYFEAPGTDSGDWALGCNLSAIDLKTRSGFGGAGPDINFPQFNGGAGNFVFHTWSTSGGSGHSYSFDYRIFQFDTY